MFSCYQIMDIMEGSMLLKSEGAKICTWSCATTCCVLPTPHDFSAWYRNIFKIACKICFTPFHYSRLNLNAFIQAIELGVENHYSDQLPTSTSHRQLGISARFSSQTPKRTSRRNAGSGQNVHTLCTSNGSPYQNFQNRIMYGTYKIVQRMPGGETLVGFTRILHRTTDDELMTVRLMFPIRSSNGRFGRLCQSWLKNKCVNGVTRSCLVLSEDMTTTNTTCAYDLSWIETVWPQQFWFLTDCRKLNLYPGMVDSSPHPWLQSHLA